MKELLGRIFSYMLARRQAGVEGTECQGLKDFLAIQVPDASEEESVISTQGVLPELADNQDSLKAIKYWTTCPACMASGPTPKRTWWLEKIFTQMQRLKRQYGAGLDWLLPYPGDLHVLKNFQPVLARLYFHAGLQQMAKEAGYKWSKLTALETCSHFKHTHVFLLESYESIYMHALSTYFSANHADVATVGGFNAFLTTRLAKTAKLWTNCLKDLGTYVMFWLSLRTASCQVRMGTLKKMAQLFHAFDRPNYMELTAMHFADVWQLPPAVLQHFEKGAFTASITGSCG